MIGNNTMRKMAWMMAACLIALLAACGGGDGGDDPAAGAPAQTGNITPDDPPPAVVGATGPSAMPTASDAANTVPVAVRTASGRSPNFPVVSVTVCSPGTDASTTCATIDNVLLDTGSYGLRLFASAVPAGTLAALAPQKSGAGTVAECALFADSNAWGTVRTADIRMASEVAQNVPVHIWADTSASVDVPLSAPSPCQMNSSLSNVSDLGANGILGVGVAPADCPGCARTASQQFYYTCLRHACTPSVQAVANQVGNPVGRFARDNNGIILEMSPVADNGQATATGTLVFGIDTAPNNALSGAGATLLATSNSGNFQAVYKGANVQTFADSGSNGYFFQDTTLPVSSSNGVWYAPASTQALSLDVSNWSSTGTAGTTVDFNVANADTLFATRASAFNNLAGSIPGSFDLGMPFFYGRHVYYGISNTSSTGGGSGPYVAYLSK